MIDPKQLNSLLNDITWDDDMLINPDDTEELDIDVDLEVDHEDYL